MNKLMMACGLMAVSAFAGVKNYGTAGCGLGSMVMGKSGGQISAATTNGTSASQIFGITSGTSNCTDNGVALKEREGEAFAEANLQVLKLEMAQGQGESLDAFASVMGCTGEQAESFKADLKGMATADLNLETLLQGASQSAESCQMN